MNVVEKEVIAAVDKECAAAINSFGYFHSDGEAYATIREEMEETQEEMCRAEQLVKTMWASCRTNSHNGFYCDASMLYEIGIRAACEAIQMAATAKKAMDGFEKESKNFSGRNIFRKDCKWHLTNSNGEDCCSRVPGVHQLGCIKHCNIYIPKHSDVDE